MRILAVADVESRYYYEHYAPGRFRDIDLLLSCGDLRRDYLEFLVTMANRPLLYVPGNHDEGFADEPPEGCVCIDDRLYVRNGVRFLGLGGSFRYRPGRYMYTERQMRQRILRLTPAIIRHGGFDVLVTHAPARHVNDLDSPAHRGFSCFTELMDRWQPAVFVHGHVHRGYAMSVPQRDRYGDTLVLNACEHCRFEL